MKQTHFKAIVEQTRKAYEKEIGKSAEQKKRVEREQLKLDKQIERVMDLYSRGKISPDIIEKQIQALESQKADLQLELDGEPLAGNVIHRFERGKSHKVRVLLPT